MRKEQYTSQMTWVRFQKNIEKRSKRRYLQKNQPLLHLLLHPLHYLRGEAVKESGQMPSPQQKDMLGRGEEWWRAKTVEWNEKLKTARKNYESAYGERKAKEQELEASKFKPDSFKRKLKAEIKALEEKVKDWENQMKEAGNMLENVLPKQAQDDRANPDWLKIEEKK